VTNSANEMKEKRRTQKAFEHSDVKVIDLLSNFKWILFCKELQCRAHPMLASEQTQPLPPGIV